MKFLAGCPAFYSSMLGGSRSTSLMSSTLILHQCPACLVRLTWIVFVMDGKWPYSCCFVGCCLQNLFNITCIILVQLPSSFFSIRLVSIHVVHPYSSIDTTAAWKKRHFILSVRSDSYMTDYLWLTGHTFASRVLMSVSVDEMLLPRQVNLSTSFNLIYWFYFKLVFFSHIRSLCVKSRQFVS